ncbi:uncharacterized protein LOC117107072 [Anneissia japonica]|uniref:uncharacterized protein LOC117107072 n=1 Tax=Anneissia japonica TaxID=1529436 RepID=UPI00142551A0|nr:uncharacterized protein LOC117107072 [Anneissia japonica]
MVDTNTTYENIHFIRSPEEWQEKAEIAKRNLQVNNDSYRYASALRDIQEPSELVCEEHKDLEPIYMNTRPVSVVNQPPPPIERAVPTQPPQLPIRPKIKQNEKGPATPPKPPVKPKPKNRKTLACGNIDDSVRELVRQQGKTVTINIPRDILINNKIKLAEINNGIWFGGFEYDCPEKTLSDCILFGDQLVVINDQWLNSAKFAGNIIQTARRQEVSLYVKRLPHAQIITIHREYEQQRLGLECHRREITNVSADEIASTQGRLRPEATGISGMNCNWTITHLNSSPIPPNITTEMMEEKLKMAGKTVHLIVQPTDFVKEITSLE